MVGIYFSGTGNTRHCVKKLVALLDTSASCFPLESEKCRKKIEENDTIVLGYPTQFSNAPYMVQEFIRLNSDLWKNKKIFCLNTMGLFSGDGTGCVARLLKKFGAIILGGMQIIMPDNVCDSKLLKKSLEKNKSIVCEADKRIEQAAIEIRQGVYLQEGLSFAAHLKGLFGQRLWFYTKTQGYNDKLKISPECIGCGLCVRVCPMKNIHMENNRAVSKNRCTMCYRCISLCPKQAITLIGKKVYEQCRFENYV